MDSPVRYEGTVRVIGWWSAVWQHEGKPEDVTIALV